MSAVGFKRLLPIILVASILTPISTVAKAAETVTEVSFPDGSFNVRWILTIKHPETVNCSEYYQNCSFEIVVTKKWVQDLSVGRQGGYAPYLPASNSGYTNLTYDFLNIVDESGKELWKIISGTPVYTDKSAKEFITLRYNQPTKVKFGMAEHTYGNFNKGFKVSGAGYINLEGPTQEQKSALEEELVREQDWAEESDDDGFTSYFQISKGWSDDTVRIGCEKRKLYVVVMTPYASSYGWTGSGQYKIDKQKPVKFSYTVSRNFRGVFMNNPKSFTSKLLKSKENFSFKMSSVLETYTFEHTKGNISDYQNKFKSMGCSLK